MGHSPTIKEQKDLHNEVTSYLNQCLQDVKDSAASDLAKFDKNINDYYNNNKWTMTLMGQGEHADYKQIHEFSVDGITKTLKGIVNGFFGGENLPEGSSKTPDAKKLPSLVSLSEQELVLQAALILVSNILAAFSTKTELSYTSTSQQFMVKPGLTLHVFVMNAEYQSKNYFNNETIEQNVFNYKLVWSAEQEKAVGQKDVMDGYMDGLHKAIKALQDKQNQFNEEAAKLNPDLKLLEGMQQLMDFLDKQITSYRKRLNDATLKKALVAYAQ